MKVFYWLIVIMEITLVVLLWFQVYTRYLQATIPGYGYPSRAAGSDTAIPVILLGVILNTAAIVLLIFDTRRRRKDAESRRVVLREPDDRERVAEQDEIKDLEDRLERVVARLGELRKDHSRQ